MPLIRRELPSGLIQRIFTVLNFSADCRCGFESGIAARSDSYSAGESAGHVVVGDILAKIESERQWASDGFAAAENQRLFRADGITWEELGGGVGRDAAGAAESASALSIDGFRAVENQRLFLTDDIVRTELATTVSYDRMGLVEAPAGVLADARALGEDGATGSFGVDLPAGIENLGLFLRDEIARAELGARSSSDRVGLIEAPAVTSTDAWALAENIRKGFFIDVVGAMEFVRSQVSDAVTRAENQALFRSDAAAWSELAIGWVNDTFANAEYLGQVRGDRPAAVEIVARALSDVAGAIEASGSVEMSADTRSAYIELRGSVVTDRWIWGENVATAGSTTLTADASGGLELLSVRAIDRGAIGELLSSVLIDRWPLAENATGLRVADSIAGVENRSLWVIDGSSWIEARSGAFVADEVAVFEAMLQMAIDRLATAENAAGMAADSITKMENQVNRLADSVPRIEMRSGAFVSDAFGAQEALIGMAADTRGIVEMLCMLAADVVTGAAENRAIRFDDVTILLEEAAAVRGRGSGTQENFSLIIVSTDLQAVVEAQGLRNVFSDSGAAAEISGRWLAFPADLVGLTEFGQAGGDDALIQIEIQAIQAFPFDPDGSVLIDGPYVVLDKTHTAVSSSRVRIITVPYASLVLSIQPFDPIAADTLDIFAFDFTLDAVGATITQTSWTATFDPGSTAARDDVPQARVITAWPTSTLYTVNPFDNSIQTWNGAFTAAMIGACPASAAGGTYTLTANVTLSDTRVLQISTTVLCVARQA